MAGRPDIVLQKYGAAIFVHGCFWHRHGCRSHNDSNALRTCQSSRLTKFRENIERDRRNVERIGELKAGEL